MENQGLSDLFPNDYSGIAQVVSIAASKSNKENSIISFKDVNTRRLFKVVVSNDNPALNEAKELLQSICDVTISLITTKDGVVRGCVSAGSISKALKKSDLEDYILMPSFDI